MDAAPQEGGVVQEGGTQEAGADAGAKFSGLVTITELTGYTAYGTPKPDAGAPVTLLSTKITFDKPDTTIKPDFIDAPKPPNCVGYKWSKGQMWNRTAGDAGKIKITGHLEKMYVDGDSSSPTPTKLPKTLECTRAEGVTKGLFLYGCGLPAKTVLVAGSVLTDTVDLEFDILGGADIGAFKETGVKVAPQIKAKSTFDMYNVDPSKGIKGEWETVSADLVAVIVRASLKDGSEFADISCSELAVSGSKEIPADALKLLPKPTATNPLIIQTLLVPFKVKGSVGAWGDYKVGAGRGIFGVSCRLASGPCP